MKRTMIVLAMFCTSLGANAQTWDEWFHQEKTQLAYLSEQLSALQLYGKAVKKGFDLVHGGLAQIGQQKERDYFLHREHFASLGLVKQTVKEKSGLSAFVLRGQEVRSICDNSRKSLLMDHVFTRDELTYFENVLTDVLKQVRAIELEAESLVADNTLLLGDDERLNRLLALEKEMEGLYDFARHFQSSIVLTALHRIQEQKDAERLRALY